MAKAKIAETDLARPVVEWLREWNWTVYQEVEHYRGGTVADLVAVQDGLVWIIEVKTSLNLSLLAQAYDWKYYAHFISVAVPTISKHSSGRDIAEKILKDWGIGLIEVGDSDVSESQEPRLHRKGRMREFREGLREEQKTWAEAGNNEGRRYTPFQGTKRDVQLYVKRHPGCTIKDLIDNVKHHYYTTGSAGACLMRWIQNGVIDGIKLDTAQRPYRLYPEGTDGN